MRRLRLRRLLEEGKTSKNSRVWVSSGVWLQLRVAALSVLLACCVLFVLSACCTLPAFRSRYAFRSASCLFFLLLLLLRLLLPLFTTISRRLLPGKFNLSLYLFHKIPATTCPPLTSYQMHGNILHYFYCNCNETR